MATAPQLARRFTPEQSRQTQTESGDMLRARRDSRAPLLQRARAGSLDERAYDVSGEDSEEDDDEPRREGAAKMSPSINTRWVFLLPERL